MCRSFFKGTLKKETLKTSLHISLISQTKNQIFKTHKKDMSAFDQRVCEWLNTATIPTNKKQTVLNRVSVSISNYRALEIDKAHPAVAAAANSTTGANAAAAASVTQTPRTPGRSTGTARSNAAVTPTTARSSYRGRTSGGSGLLSPMSPQSNADNSPGRASAAGGFTVPQLEVDYALQQRIAKALRRLQEGDEGDNANPLFPFTLTAHRHADPNASTPNNGNSPTNAADGQRDYANEAEAADGEKAEDESVGRNNANDMLGEDGDESQPFARPDNETGAYTVGFTFGDAPDENFVGTHGNDADDGEGGDDHATMTEREDARRRLTMKRKSRNAISAETVDPEAAMAFTAAVIEKEASHRAAIIAALETHHLFSHLDDDDIAFAADIMTVHSFGAGENIVTKLSPCDDMLVIVEGEAIVVDTVTGDEYEEYTNEAKPTTGKATAIHRTANSDNGRPAATAAADLEACASASSPTAVSSCRNGTVIGVGKTLGDLGLMYHTIQPETIDAVSAASSAYTASSSSSSSGAAPAVVCCAISRNAYKNICAKASKIKRERYEGFLANVKFLQNLEKEERLRLADALKSAKYSKGEKIIKYGEEGTWFNIILDGRVDVIGRDANGAEVHVCSFKEGDCVGELEFIFGHKTVADCVAGTPIVKTAKMTANHFEKVIGPAKEVLESRAGGDNVYSYYRQTNKVK